MKFLILVFAFAGGLLLLASCGSDKTADESNTTQQSTKKNQFKGIQQTEKPSLREQKTGEFFSSKMLPISELKPETNQDIYVHLTGQVVNVNENQTWAVVQDKGIAYYAFNHAGMPKIQKDFLGKKIYLRAIIEELPLSDSILMNIKNNGLAPGFATENVVKGYQFNTTKAALADGTDEKKFMTP